MSEIKLCSCKNIKKQDIEGLFVFHCKKCGGVIPVYTTEENNKTNIKWV